MIREVSLSAMIIHGFLTVFVIATIVTGAIITGPTTTRTPPQEINHAETTATANATANASANDVTPIGNIIFYFFDFIFKNYFLIILCISMFVSNGRKCYNNVMINFYNYVYRTIHHK